jgi:hypothetical protein
MLEQNHFIPIVESPSGFDFWIVRARAIWLWVNWAVIFSVAVEFDGYLVARLGAGVGSGLPVDDQEGGIRSLTINDSLLAIFNPTNRKNSRPIIVMEKSKVKVKVKVKCVFEKVNKAKRELAQLGMSLIQTPKFTTLTAVNSTG